MGYIKIKNDSYCQVTREGDPNNRWDGDDTYCGHNIRGIYEVAPDTYYNLQVGFDLDPEEVYYLLYVIYDTGNSFHQEEGRISFVEVYKDKNVAYENERRINEHAELYKKLEKMNMYHHSLTKGEKKNLQKLQKTFSEFSVKLIGENEVEFTFSTSWLGYFERLVDVIVEPVLVILEQ